MIKLLNCFVVIVIILSGCTSMPETETDKGEMTFYRVLISDEKYEERYLLKTLFGRSLLENVSFRNSDLSGSTLTWSDFINVNFSYANLSNSDLRSSVFENVDFSNSNLSNSDLRGLDLKTCNLSGAIMTSAKATHELKNQNVLSPKQIQEIEWHDDEGEEPEGG